MSVSLASTAAQTTVAHALGLIGEWTQDDWLDDVNTAPSVVAVASPGLRNPTDSPDLYVGSWLCLPTREHPDRERQVETYAPTAGTVAFPTVPAAPPPIAAGEPIQLWTRWRPRDVEEQLIRAQRTMYAPARAGVTGADLDGRRQINLTALVPALQTPAQLIGITELTGSVPARRRAYVPGTDFEAYLEGSALLVQLTLAGPTYDATKTLAIAYWVAYDAITPLPFGQLSTATTAAPAEWLAWETILRLSQTRAYRDPDLEKRAQAELVGWRAQYESSQGYRGFPPGEPWAAGLGIPP